MVSRPAREHRWPRSGRPAVAAIISSLLVLPLVVLEVINQRGAPGGFPILLFAVLWVLPWTCTLMLIPLVQQLLRGSKAANPVRLLPRVLFSILLAWLWIGLVIDQMPCFLGVPNCD